MLINECSSNVDRCGQPVRQVRQCVESIDVYRHPTRRVYGSFVRMHMPMLTIDLKDSAPRFSSANSDGDLEIDKSTPLPPLDHHRLSV